jgi:hypothetical protein
MVCFLMVASIEVTPRTQKEKIPVAHFSPNEMRRPGMIRKSVKRFSEKVMPKQEDAARHVRYAEFEAAKLLRASAVRKLRYGPL